MPIYEYACSACGQVSEVLQKMQDLPPALCPDCGSEGSLSRVLSSPGFRLKGGGWYETDFKTSRQRNLAEKPEPVSEKN